MTEESLACPPWCETDHLSELERQLSQTEDLNGRRPDLVNPVAPITDRWCRASVGAMQVQPGPGLPLTVEVQLERWSCPENGEHMDPGVLVDGHYLESLTPAEARTLAALLLEAAARLMPPASNPPATCT